MHPMRRVVAAWAGCLLMLSSSWSFATGGVIAAASSASSSSDSAASSGSSGTSTSRGPYGPYGPYGSKAPATPRTTPTPPADPNSLTGTPIAPTDSSDNGLFGNLPDLGGPAYASLTRADEAQIGQMIINQIRNQNLLLQDPEVDEYLQDLGMRLASQAHDPDQQFHYVCMRDPEINAFATFGGYVFVFTGLILVTHNEAELASVMAHETGHVVQRHMARALEAESHMSLASTAAMLAAALLGAAAGGPNSGEAIEGAIATAQAVTMQRAINYTRSQEMEADYVGIHLLAAAGFDPYAMANFFETLQQSMGMAESEIPALLIDHPVTDERIAAARSRAAQFQRLTSYEESSLYPFIKERVRVLSAPPEARIAQYYAGLRERRELTPAERYGEALVQVQEGHASQAVPTLRQLQAGHPEMILLYTALGQALQAAGKPREALAQFALAEQLFPHNVPLTVHYAETLMKTGQPAQAHALLLDLFNNVDPTPPQIQLTAIAASAAGDTGDAYYYMGEYNLANGQLALADQELELALASPHLSNIQRARFLARLEQVRGWMREQQAARHGG